MPSVWVIIGEKETAAAAAAAKSLQSCPILCDPIDSSPPGATIPGILQARTLEWVAISFSSAWKWKGKVKLLSCVRLLVTPWTTAYQAPPSMGFSSKSTGVGCHCLLWKRSLDLSKIWSTWPLHKGGCQKYRREKGRKDCLNIVDYYQSCEIHADLFSIVLFGTWKDCFNI